MGVAGGGWCCVVGVSLCWNISGRLAVAHVDVLDPGWTLFVAGGMLLVAVDAFEMLLVVCVAVDGAGSGFMVSAALYTLGGERAVARSMAKHLAVMALGGALGAAVVLPDHNDIVNIFDLLQITEFSRTLRKVDDVVGLVVESRCLDCHFFNFNWY